MRRWLLIVPLTLSLVLTGCGGSAEEPTEIPKSPPKGKSLPRFAKAEAQRIMLV